MASHYVLEVYAVEVMESAGREGDIVTLEINGELKPKTRKRIEAAIAAEDWTIRNKKKVLA